MTITPRRVTAALGATGLLLGLPAAAYAESAPPAESSAVAAELEPLGAIGESHTTADSTNAEGDANALRAGDAPPAEQFGGSASTSEGSGEASGALVDTGENDQGRARVFGWSATATNTDKRSADAEASLFSGHLGGEEGVVLTILGSQTHAEHTDAKSSSTASSDGARLSLAGQIVLTLLHAEASSEGTGHSYVLGINDTHLLTSEQANGACALPENPVINLSCLTATGGPGSFAAQVAEAIIGGDGGLHGTVSGTEATGAEATGNAAPATPDQVLGGTTEPAPDGPTGDLGRPAGTLPFTGSSPWFLTAAGAALVALGAASRKLGLALRLVRA